MTTARINEREASVVRLIFSMFLEGYRYKAIQDALKKKGFVTKRGRPFGKNSIYEILRNPKCAGYLLGGRLKTLKSRREELQCRLDTLRSPMEGLTEEMVVQYLLTTKKTLVNRENLVECKKIMDLYVHQIKVFNDDCIDILFKIPLGADKGGVGGGT
ncbi:recombinase family protein [Desulfallas sp. Bu1-1]|uniref:recombinase family protein n=1 Tax=Desulfallas sp. Bu1-1 TaxID=2787620 RepID=UPI001FAD1C9F|nr:recombinase family protein [Desulfallas sp. Bu1-1]